MNKDINKPNKKTEIIGLIMLWIGIAMVLLRIFAIKETVLLIIGIILILLGSVVNMTGKVGAEKVVEMTSTYEKAKAKTIAKSIKEGLKDEDK